MPVKSRQRPDTTRGFAVNAAQLLEDRHCEDVRLLDVRGLSQVCDYVLVATGTSDRQMKAVAHELEKLGASQDNKVYRSSRDDGGTWVVVDFVNLVAHLFEPNQRSYYDIETLWDDAVNVDWKRDGKQRSKPPASSASADDREKPAPKTPAKPPAKTAAKSAAKKKRTTKKKSPSRKRA